jgi:alpha-amylase
LRKPASLRVTCLILVAILAACGGGSTPTPTPTPPPNQGWWRDRVVYEIFVRSFADSDGDGVGDLRGLTAHLDDLNDGNPATTTDLGVDAIWLMPIFPSPSYHGYDVSDYRSINPQYGTLADFDAFVAAAHQRGIKVILDMVLNHSSWSHPWFADSSQGTGSAKRDWYVWSATDPGWQNPLGGGGSPWRNSAGAFYYAVFSPTMPDLNLGNAAVEQELVDTMRFWLARGVDGFRLDAVPYFFASGPQRYEQRDQPPTHDFLRRIRATLQKDYPEVLLAAEAWTDQGTVATYFGQGDEVHLAFAFDQASATKSSIAAGVSDALVNSLALTESVLAGKDRGFDAPFLSNHDQVRVARTLGGDPGSLRVAAATLLALPGTPFLYYGEEIGMQGGPGTPDQDKRTPIRWTATPPVYGFTSGSTTWYGATSEAAGVDVATQRADPSSLRSLYRSLIALRKSTAPLTAGDAVRPVVTGAGPGVLALVRSASGKAVVFVANFAATATGPLSIDVTGTPRVLLAEGLAGAPSAAGGKLSLPGLGARAFAFLQMD